MTFKLTGAETDGGMFVMAQTFRRRATPPGLHVRTREDQVWFVLEHVSGRLT